MDLTTLEQNPIHHNDLVHSMKSCYLLVLVLLLTALRFSYIGYFQKVVPPFNVISSTVKLNRDCDRDSTSSTSLSSSMYSKEEQYILSALSRSNPKSKGYIVFKENEAFGIGNVYRSFASVFLLAIVTNRTLYADYSLYFVYFQPKLPVVLNVNEDTYNSDNSYIWYDHTIGDYYRDRSFTGKNLVDYWKQDVVVFNTITDMSHLILDNPDHMQLMRQLGIVHSNDYHTQHYEMLHYAYKILFSNKISFMRTLDSWRPQFKPHRIGAQLRFGGKEANSNEAVAYLSSSDVELCIDTIKRYIKDHRYHPSTVTIHVSTDNDNALRKMQEAFPGSVFVPPKHTIVHTSFVQSKQRFDGYYTALVDIALLRECEFLILTKGSSFGWTMGMQMEPLNAMYLRRGVISNTTILIN